MALKSTVFKANLQLADMDRAIYGDRAVVIARHPSETDERMMVRVLAYALNVPANDDNGALDFGKGLSDVDEPDLQRCDLTGQLEHWIELGLPDDKRLSKACSRASHVTVYAYASSTDVWWNGIRTRLTKLRNLEVLRIPAAQSQALAGLAQRTMQLQITVQDGAVWIGNGQTSVDVTIESLMSPAPALSRKARE